MVRSIADKADPSTKKRLLDLAEGYQDRVGCLSRAIVRPTNLPVMRDLIWPNSWGFSVRVLTAGTVAAGILYFQNTNNGNLRGRRQVE